jgi:hypothetical protein
MKKGRHATNAAPLLSTHHPNTRSTPYDPSEANPTMKTMLLAAGLILAMIAPAAFAQTRSVSGSTSTSTSTASASPHQSQTAGAQANNAFTYAPVTNVPAATSNDDHSNQHVSGISPDLMVGGYASSGSNDQCGQTKQFGASAFGASAVYGSSDHDQQCYDLRSADYRDRMAFALEALAKNHPGFEGQAINGELAELYEMNVDICHAERRLSASDCETWAAAHTPTATELQNADAKPVAASH